MIVAENTREVIQIGSSFKKEEFFKIKDVGFVFEILRSKLYSNPLRTMIQEIISNAVDANKEANRPEEPVEVTFPNIENEYLIIKDHGIGISPERMNDVFISYGSSTKTGSNDQIGGFGIGAKLPFAYTDTFYIETISGDNGTRKLRKYMAFIDKTNIGKLSLISEHKTDKPTGTSIIIPSQKKDFGFIRDYLKDICNFFIVKPIITNDKYFNFRNWIKKIPGLHNGEKWDFIEQGFNNNNPIILIGNIPYNLELNKFETLNEEKKYIKYVSRYHGIGLVMKFNVGEISVSASREQIEVTRRNYLKIARRLRLIAFQIKRYAFRIINSFSNKLKQSKCAHRIADFCQDFFGYDFVDFKFLDGENLFKNIACCMSYRPKSYEMGSKIPDKVFYVYKNRGMRCFGERIERIFELNPEYNMVEVIENWERVKNSFEKSEGKYNNANTYEAVPLERFDYESSKDAEKKDRKKILKKEERIVDIHVLGFDKDGRLKEYCHHLKFPQAIEFFKKKKIATVIDWNSYRINVDGIKSLTKNEYEFLGATMKQFDFSIVGYSMKSYVLKEVSKHCKIFTLKDRIGEFLANNLVKVEREMFLHKVVTMLRYQMIDFIFSKKEQIKNKIFFLNKLFTNFTFIKINKELSYKGIASFFNTLRYNLGIELPLNFLKYKKELRKIRLIAKLVKKYKNEFLFEKIIKAGLDHLWEINPDYRPTYDDASNTVEYIMNKYMKNI